VLGGQPVSCEKVLIGQVVMNLAFNALEELARWPDEPGAVTIATRRRADCAEVEVRDTGSGLPALPGGRIFDGAFTSKGNGHGIGPTRTRSPGARSCPVARPQAETESESSTTGST
ncbi:ATP-binding protein, partial [Streptomyces diastaticus]|uniref:ATP-binding protein n=1 Tax=Streptomyces diastaticus TaxID=1956 RepID=UPI003665D00E